MVSAITRDSRAFSNLEADARRSLRRFRRYALSIARACDHARSPQQLVESYSRALSVGSQSAAQAAWVNFYVQLQLFTDAAVRDLRAPREPAIDRALATFFQILDDDLGRLLFSDVRSARA